MKKILQVVSCLAKGGTEAFIMNNFRNIDRQKYTFDFLVFTDIVDPMYADEIRELGGHIYCCMSPKLAHINAFIKNAIGIMKDNGPYDAVHAHINIANAWIMYAAYKAGIREIISHSHDISCKETDNFIKKIYIKLQTHLIKKYSTIKLACSELSGEYLYGKKSKTNQWHVIHNGIDIHKFINVSQGKVDELRKIFSIENYKYVFGNITRFDENKNISFVVEVFNEILKKRPNSVLLLGGVDGGQLNMIKQKVADNNLSDNVRFIGIRNDIEVCLKLMDTYIFPSFFEGLGIVSIEAQAAGIHCVCSNAVPLEADMDLNLIEFVDLKKSAGEWSDIIINTLNCRRPTNKEIIQEFIKRGYDINDSVKVLEKVYNGDWNEKEN